MPRKKKRKTIVYKNLLEDDFAGTAIKKEEVGADYTGFPRLENMQLAAVLSGCDPNCIRNQQIVSWNAV